MTVNSRSNILGSLTPGPGARDLGMTANGLARQTMVELRDVASTNSPGFRAVADVEGMLPALAWLDSLLEHAVAVAQTVYGPQATTDRFRGLHVGQSEVERLLTRQPGSPILYAAGFDLDGAIPGPFAAAARLLW